MRFTHRYPVCVVPISQVFQMVPNWEKEDTGTQESQAGDRSPAVNVFNDLEQGASPL